MKKTVVFPWPNYGRLWPLLVECRHPKESRSENNGYIGLIIHRFLYKKKKWKLSAKRLSIMMILRGAAFKFHFCVYVSVCTETQRNNN